MGRQFTSGAPRSRPAELAPPVLSDYQPLRAAASEPNGREQGGPKAADTEGVAFCVPLPHQVQTKSVKYLVETSPNP
jgi:hypothetical protein